MQEKLLGFVLQALDADEQREVQEALRNDPQLCDELARLQAAVAPLHVDRDHHAPPRGLAERTCSFVLAVEAAPVQLAPLAGAVGARSGGWTLADLVVAAGICASAAFLFFPAIAQSRFQSHLAQCRFNLSQIGTAAANYDSHHGHFPTVPSSGRLAAAGLYAPILLGDGYLTDSRVFVCPGSELAEEATGFHVPNIDELKSADETVLRTLKRTMGGSYGYSLGYVQEGQYLPVRNQNRAEYAIAGDAPSQHLASHQSANHGGKGQNLLFECGSVKYLTNCTTSCTDNVYLSDRQLVEPGRHANDAVLGASDTAPMLFDMKP